jgi:DNA-binding MarR family transcriptional regulator
MDIICEIRRRHLIQKQTITAIARDMDISQPTVCKHLNTVEKRKYERVPLAPRHMS